MEQNKRGTTTNKLTPQEASEAALIEMLYETWVISHPHLLNDALAIFRAGYLQGLKEAVRILKD